jgi:hypothetical protein
MLDQRLRKNLVQGDGTRSLTYEFNLPPTHGQPVGHLGRIGNADTHEQKLRPCRSGGEGYLVAGTSLGVSQELILVHHKEVGTFSPKHGSTLRLQCGNHHTSFGLVTNVSRDKPDLPSAISPFPKLVVGQGPGGHGVNRPPSPTRFHEKLEDKSLPRPRGCMEDNVSTFPEIPEGLALPRIGKGKLFSEFFSIRLHHGPLHIDWKLL